MNKIICTIFGHKEYSHLDYIWGNLPREHKKCLRCGKGLMFERPTEEREKELYEKGDIRDGDNRGCKSI